jgi:alpha-glucosidase
MGGFIGLPSSDLYCRWITLGVFTPFLRGHNVHNEKSKEPWAFGAEVENHARNMLNLRYRLLPYIYSSFYTATQTGMPVSRSLTINYTFDDSIYKPAYQNEYLFGPSFLVTPVSSGTTFAKIYLPKGTWYRFTSNQRIEGNQEILVEIPIHDLPVFVKESAIIPMQSVIQNTSEKPSDTLTLCVYKGTEPNKFTYYEDDGVSYEFEKGVCFKRDVRYEPGNKTLLLDKIEGTLQSKFKVARILLIGFDQKTVTVDNQETVLTDEHAVIVPFNKEVSIGL